jgi:phosphomannomutase
VNPELLSAARAWVDHDPDPSTAAAVRGWLDAGDHAAIAEHFGQRLEFGTAGMRGALGPGPNRMNRALVRRVSWALGATLTAFDLGSAELGPVVVGYDGRHLSREMALDTAAVLVAAGHPVVRFDEPVPTPLVAFVARRLRARAAVVVTASHNPPADNGYKVFWSDGAQIIPPVDAAISAAIDRAPAEVPLADADRVALVGSERVDEYVRAVLALRVRRDVDVSRVRVVYTPLHGVGRDLLLRVLTAAGYRDVHVVAEQAEPDGDFPTVAFPNPEERGALDLAVALAKRVDADVLIANDPDADRLAVALPVRGGAREFEALSGNDVGNLLAAELLANGAPGKRGVATTVVSSTRLRALADHFGVEFHATLTGFKWLSRAMIDLEARGGRLVLGYEEALGYSVDGLVRDKDGVSAALLFCDLVAARLAAGADAWQALDDLDRLTGVYRTGQRSVPFPGASGPASQRAALSRLRAHPPTGLAGRGIVAMVDHNTAPTGPRTDLLELSLDGGARVLLRPSGTEPKLKIYAEVCAPGRAGRAARAEADAALNEVLTAAVDLVVGSSAG